MSSEALSDFKDVSQKIRALDKEVKVQYYSNNSFSVFDAHNSRLKEVKGCLRRLEEIANVFKELSEIHKTEKDYYLKLAYTDALSAMIYSRRSDYLSFLNIYFNLNPDSRIKAKQEFEELTSEWEEKELYHIGLLKQRIKLVREYDKNNVEAEMLGSYELLLEHQYPGAIKKIEEQIATFQAQRFSKTSENFIIEARVCQLLTWKAFAQFEMRDVSAFIITLKELLAYSEPAENVLWAKECLRKHEQKAQLGMELIIMPVEFPRSSSAIEQTIINLEPTIDKKSHLVCFQTASFPIDRNPQKLVDQLNSAWEELSLMEQQLWDTARAEFINIIDRRGKFKTNEKGERLYNRKAIIYVLPDEKNKGFSKKNRLRFMRYLATALEVRNRFELCYEGLSALSRLNLDNVYFRVAKIKAGLGLFYLNKNARSYLAILNYYKQNGKSLSPAKRALLHDLFNKNPISEIEQDLDYLQKNYSDNLLCLLVKAEAAIFLEDPISALETIENVEKSLPPNALLENIDPFSRIEMCKSYLYFKNRDLKGVGASLEKLRAMNTSEKWSSGLSARNELLKLEKDAIEESR